MHQVPIHPHALEATYKPIPNYIIKGALNIHKKACSKLTLTLSILNLIYKVHHSIYNTALAASSKLALIKEPLRLYKVYNKICY